MGIESKEFIKIKTQDEFHKIDKMVMKYAFETQNRLGRFCDEKIYQEILAQKCRDELLKAEKEVEIVLTYKDFKKKYKLDLLVDNGIIYELKTVDALNNIHKLQLINYLMLTGIKHGRLINFRPTSVEYRFVSTTLTSEDRYNCSIDTTEWLESTCKCGKLKDTLENLLKEWGVFLDYKLYNEAVVHFLGGLEKVVLPVNILLDNKVVGKQKMQLLDSKTIFHFSAISRAFEGYENNIRRLIEHTDIKTVQWVNLDKRDIKLKTISR